ncbi:lipopolysaccharide biosynthesis protein [Planococcus antarcticus DSM 14505]|uniref:Lipopolysaccharide biosynthesis protein n=1 Tax=Planococcus antarcticus DSM 14505 TaxID=1185653 RepID=A0AA87LUD4_9BACL|nr:Wzz/FepE/Etk N-terminal domain-containing protein [Planococcus antarcticus]EIM07197.1 lipopolysaccharide biosynthesis protein [Planococcus antarcticus DSM 14505]
MADNKVIVHPLINLKNHVRIAFAFTLLLMLGVWVVFAFILKPQYQASSQMLIEESASATPHLAVESSRIDSQIIEAYASFAISPEILLKVKKELGLESSVADLQKQINVTHTDNSPVLTITVSSDDSYVSAKIANTIGFIFQNEVKASLKADHVNIISQALSEDKEVILSQQGLTLGLAIAAACGFIFSILITFSTVAVKAAVDSTNRVIRKKENQLQTVFK